MNRNKQGDAISSFQYLFVFRTWATYTLCDSKNMSHWGLGPMLLYTVLTKRVGTGGSGVMGYVFKSHGWTLLWQLVSPFGEISHRNLWYFSHFRPFGIDLQFLWVTNFLVFKKNYAKFFQYMWPGSQNRKSWNCTKGLHLNVLI